jgi:hypothetical protein
VAAMRFEYEHARLTAPVARSQIAGSVLRA